MKPPYKLCYDERGQPYLEVGICCHELVEDPLLNKGTAFTDEERKTFKLAGFLPPHVATIEEQKGRVYENYLRCETPLQKHIHLRALQDRNETLYYALVADHQEEMVPIIYTPTVGEACRLYSHIYRRARGVFVTPENVGNMVSILRDTFPDEIDVIVATDSEGILGIGDQGAGGMGIPIGKLALYTLGAGIHPGKTLPVAIDIGTNNEALLKDPLYLGRREPRLTGDAYLKVIDQFVEAVRTVYPHALLQWEDFSKQNAFTVLDTYREKVLSFNDDIQGTGAVIMGGILVALKAKGRKLRDETFVFYGAGAAGIGIASHIREYLRKDGLTPDEVREHILMVDSKGLLFEDRQGMESYKREFAQPASLRAKWGIPAGQTVPVMEVVKKSKATALLGVSGRPGQIKQDLVQAMCANVDQPLIFPLSNPNSLCEAAPADLIQWSEGKALVATGSPFAPVKFGNRTIVIGQGNNAFAFPGIGLGALAARARVVTDGMLLAASSAIVKMVDEERTEQGAFFPPIPNLRLVNTAVAEAVAEEAWRSGVAGVPRPRDVHPFILDKQWLPRYLPFRPAENPF